MKIMRQLFVLVFLAVSMTVAAQDEMTKALLDYVKACPSATTGMGVGGNMGEALKMVNQELIKNYNGKTSEGLVSDYMKNHLLNDMVEKVMDPAMKEFVTVNEVKQLTAAMSSPEGKLFQQHQKKINESTDFEKMGESVMKTLLDNEEPKDIKPDPACPKTYISTFNKYYELSNLGSFIDQMGAMFGDKKDDPKVIKYLDYLKKNMATIYLNNYYGAMTMDDLKFGMKVYQTDAWKHMMQAQSKMVSDPQKLGMGIVMSYINWLTEQGVEIKDM